MKRVGICLILLLVVGMTSTSAAEDQTMIIFSGNSREFVAPDGEWVNLRMMDPGERRTQGMILDNTSQDAMDFYMSVDVMENIAQKAEGNARYQVQVTSGDRVLLSEWVDAGKRNTDSKLGKEWKIATLQEGEKREVDLTLTLDGRSMTNNYQGQEGKLQIIFAVQDRTDSGSPGIDGQQTTKSPVVLHTGTGARTGDALYWGAVGALCVMIAAGVAGVTVLLVRERRRRNRNLEGIQEEYSDS